MKAQHQKTYKALPAFLRSMREKAGFTQRQLAKAVNRPQSWVFNNEAGVRRTDISEFILIAKACGVDPKKAFTILLKTIDEL